MKTQKLHPGRSGNADKNSFLRSYRFEIRLAPDELEAIKARCSQSVHNSLAAYARDFLVSASGGTAKDKLAVINKTALALNRIGNNINQIARHLNTHKQDANTERMAQALQGLQHDMALIRDELVKARK